jgi:hypothetical protein
MLKDEVEKKQLKKNDQSQHDILAKLASRIIKPE